MTIEVTTTQEPGERHMTFGLFLATEGYRRCPQCGKYAKRDALGFIGGSGPGVHVTMYGHLPGHGCNGGQP